MITERKKFLINTTYFFVIGLIAFFTVKFLLGYLLPFVLAFLLAAVLQPLCDKMAEKLKIKRFLASFVCVLALYFLLALLLFGLTFLLIKFTESFYSDIPDIINSLIGAVEKLYNSFKNEINKIPQVANEFVDGFVGSLKELLSESAGVKLSSIVGGLAKKTPSFLLSFIITFIATFYFTNDYKKLVNFANEILPKKVFMNIAKIKNIFFHNVVKISFAYLLLGLITFVQLLAFFLIFKIKRALILAFLISFIDLLPVLGAGLVLIPWSIIAFVTGNAALGIKLAFIYAILTVVRNFTEPKIVSKQTGVGPLLTLISIFLGLKVMGAFGAVALPIFLTVLFEFYRGE